MTLADGSRVAVIGGGPAGSFFAHFLRRTTERAGIDVAIDLYEPRSFDDLGPRGCNMCGGIVSESLLQSLAAEGMNLPREVIQRRLDAYFLHMDVGSVRIETPLHEKRIAAVHRGSGPRGGDRVVSFDAYLLRLAEESGVRKVPERVKGVERRDGMPVIGTAEGTTEAYDLVAVATGVNSTALKMFEGDGRRYRSPKTVKTSICEIRLGRSMIERYLGNAMHVFLLDVPRIEFAALIPKGEYVTACLLGENTDRKLLIEFLQTPQVRACMPPHWEVPDQFCTCGPKIAVTGAFRPFDDRMVFVGDSGTSRLYKDGIGAAYRMAKAAARTAVFRGVSAEAFERGYGEACRAMARDNAIGKVVFTITSQIQSHAFARKGLWRMTAAEQRRSTGPKRMSHVLWDTFTGSATYRSVFLRSLHPGFLGRFAWEIAAGVLERKPRQERPEKEEFMSESTAGVLGKRYQDGEVIYHQGERGDTMFVIQEGEVEVVRRDGESEFHLAVLGKGDFFGEGALFADGVRPDTVRASGRVYVFTLEKQAVLKRLHEDASIAMQFLEKLSRRIRDLENALMRAASQPWTDLREEARKLKSG